MTTFEQYQAECRERQGAYISSERRKLDRAWKLWRDYTAGMEEIGLHALTRCELTRRNDEINHMVKELPTKFADSPQMRALYDLQVAHAP